MVSLLDLSNELLYKIIDDIHPDDIVNFSHVCKEIYRLAKDAVALHLQRKRTYEHIIVHGCHRHATNAHPLQLIKDTWMDWRIAEYPKSLALQCCQHPGGDDDGYDTADEDEDIVKYEVENREDDLIIQNIMQVIQGYIEEKAVEFDIHMMNDVELKNWGELIMIGDRETMFALLLLLIPNLETVSIAQSTWRCYEIEDVIRQMSKQTLQEGHMARRPLMKLSEVRFLGHRNNMRGENFTMYLRFAAFPSMRTIYGKFVEGRWDYEDEWEFKPHTSNVTEIILHNSAVNAEFPVQLSGIKALKRNYYHYEERDDYTNCRMEPHKIIGSLLEHAKHSLEFLAILGQCNLRNVRVHTDIHPCKGSLRDFEVLHEIILDSDIYIEHIPINKLNYFENEFSYVGYKEEYIRHLVDVLPPSIEVVRLIGPNVVFHTLALLEEFVELKEIRLPNLRELVLEVGLRALLPDWVNRVRQICGRVGVHVVIQMKG